MDIRKFSQFIVYEICFMLTYHELTKIGSLNITIESFILLGIYMLISTYCVIDRTRRIDKAMFFTYIKMQSVKIITSAAIATITWSIMNALDKTDNGVGNVLTALFVCHIVYAYMSMRFAYWVDHIGEPIDIIYKQTSFKGFSKDKLTLKWLTYDNRDLLFELFVFVYYMARPIVYLVSFGLVTWIAPGYMMRTHQYMSETGGDSHVG